MIHVIWCFYPKIKYALKDAEKMHIRGQLDPVAGYVFAYPSDGMK